MALPQLHVIQSVRLSELRRSMTAGSGLYWNLRMFLAIRMREETLSLSGQQVGTRWTHNTQV